MAADGAVGNTGGIGAWVAGLHEHLDAEAVLRRAAGVSMAGAGPLHSRALAHLETRREPGGFPVWPGGLPRAETTARAKAAVEAGPVG